MNFPLSRKILKKLFQSQEGVDMMQLVPMSESKSISDFFIEKTKNKTLAEISKATGISDSYLSKLRSGHYKSAGIDVGVDLSLYFNEPLKKVLGLIGKEDYYDKLKRSLVREFQKEPILNFNMPEAEIEGVKVFENPICLGPGYNMDDLKPFGHMPIPKANLPKGYKSEKDRIVCFKTKGYSMEPAIFDDSYVWIDRYIDTCLNGEIYAFLLPDNDVTVKRLLSQHEDYLIIGADNPAQADFPMILKLREAEDVSVVRGRVIWILNRLIEKSKK